MPKEGLSSILASMTATVFSAEPFLLRSRTKNLSPLSVLENDHVTALQNLERLFDFFEVIELRRTGLAKPLKPGGINKIAHRNPVNGEFLFFDGVCGFVSVNQPLRPGRAEVDGGVHQHLRQLVARRHADLLTDLHGGLNKYFGERQPIWRQVVVTERVLHVGIVQENDGPRASDEFIGANQPGGRAPDRRETGIRKFLQGRNQRLEIHAQANRCFIDAGNRRYLTVVECRHDNLLLFHGFTLIGIFSWREVYVVPFGFSPNGNPLTNGSETRSKGR